MKRVVILLVCLPIIGALYLTSCEQEEITTEEDSQIEADLNGLQIIKEGIKFEDVPADIQKLLTKPSGDIVMKSVCSPGNDVGCGGIKSKINSYMLPGNGCLTYSPSTPSPTQGLVTNWYSGNISYYVDSDDDVNLETEVLSVVDNHVQLIANYYNNFGPNPVHAISGEVYTSSITCDPHRNTYNLEVVYYASY